MDIRDFAALLTRCLAWHLLRPRILMLILALIVRSAKVWRGSFAERGVQPVIERHARATRSSFGPLPDGWIDTVHTPRYARIHDSVRFRLRRPTRRLQPSHACPLQRQSNLARVVCLENRLLSVTVNNELRNAVAGVLKLDGGPNRGTGALPRPLAGEGWGEGASATGQPPRGESPHPRLRRDLSRKRERFWHRRR